MNKIPLIFGLIVTTIFANPQVIIFDKKIYDKYQNWAYFKNKEKNIITFEKDFDEKYFIWEKFKKETGEDIPFYAFNDTQKIVKNCTEYLKYYKSYVLATDIDYKIHSEYLECEILNHIENSEVTYKQYTKVNYVDYIYKFINIKSFSNSINPKLNAEYVTLNQNFNDISQKDNLVLEINKKDWHYYFQIIGVETKDNKNYLLVSFLDQALESSYFSTSFLVFDYQNNKIKTQKQPLYKEANENSKTNMYLVINDVVEIIEEKEDWIYILYITKDEKEIKAWIPRNSLEFRSSNEE
ncbi:hypothetical protein AAX26_02027 [Aliarcobacter thereius]|uniref:hypothetical protein n=1 Tax=Aliarcobacter thereius TaxID=544718 RepID=UPI000827D831|nr:hypothetical protein [Aliarcobacter thereius]OCL85355.1 hypothetical protein AAX26_02027 [Aliarcobacter thereius]